ncbi:hypothetical protein D9758_013952 [Tetrapyrgos nigripes]|uniref:Uncharacterized protein n=1 Tax=Tetrapyrgos nigripes TaxID=182062 RepID=A0A8H5CGT6_9AGAR|nr:hypothetical protein D9758_013952 [Tetrapyrgos nigripes]
MTVTWKTLNPTLLLYAFVTANALSIDPFQMTQSVPLTLTWHRAATDPSHDWFFKKSDIFGTSSPLTIAHPADWSGQLPITFTDAGPFQLVAFENDRPFTSLGPIVTETTNFQLVAASSTPSSTASSSSVSSLRISSSHEADTPISTTAQSTTTQSTTSVQDTTLSHSTSQATTSPVSTTTATTFKSVDPGSNASSSTLSTTSSQPPNVSGPATSTGGSARFLSPSEITTILASVLGSVIFVTSGIIFLLCYRSRRRTHLSDIRYPHDLEWHSGKAIRQQQSSARHWYTPSTSLISFRFPNPRRSFSQSTSSVGPDDSISQVASPSRRTTHRTRFNSPFSRQNLRSTSNPSWIAPITEDESKSEDLGSISDESSYVEKSERDYVHHHVFPYDSETSDASETICYITQNRIRGVIPVIKTTPATPSPPSTVIKSGEVAVEGDKYSAEKGLGSTE